MLCALAGPVSNLILGFTAAVFARGSFGYIFAGTNILFGAYNLIPASGLDGGNICEAIFKRYLPIGFAESLLLVLAIICSVFVFGLGVAVFCRSYNISLMIFGVLLAVKALKWENKTYIPC